LWQEIHPQLLTPSLEYPAMPTIKRILKSKDVAHILDLSPDDVIVLARDKKLKSIKKGKYWMFSIQDVASYRKRKG
jgi:hypothetical protein